MLLTLVMMPFDRLRSDSFYYATGAAEGILRCFAFVFLGGLVAPKRWRVVAAPCLVLVGVGVYIWDHTQHSSSAQLPVWHLSRCTAGCLVAAAIQVLRGRGQNASPNGGPVEALGDSGIGELNVG